MANQAMRKAGQLTCLQNITDIEALDQARVSHEVAAGDGSIEAVLRRADWTRQGILITLTRSDGSTCALLGGTVRDTGRERFLDVGFVHVSADARRRGCARRMLAAALLRSGLHGPLPRLLALRTSEMACLELLSRLSVKIGEAVLHPDPAKNAVPLATVGAARRMAGTLAPGLRYVCATSVLCGARLALDGIVAVVPSGVRGDRLGGHDQFLVVLDLRGLDEGVLSERLRLIYRGR